MYAQKPLMLQAHGEEEKGGKRVGRQRWQGEGWGCLMLKKHHKHLLFAGSHTNLSFTQPQPPMENHETGLQSVVLYHGYLNYGVL